MRRYRYGLGAAQRCASVAAPIVDGVGVEHFPPTPGARHADPPTLMYRGREIADDQHRLIVRQTMSQESEHRKLTRLRVEPLEAARVVVARMQRRTAAIERVEIADQTLHAGMLRFGEQSPVKRLIMIPLAPLGELAAHEQQVGRFQVSVNDARGLVAALALGADGINMGSRFMCTVESCIHQNVKDAIVAASELDTRLVMRPLRNTERVLRNAAVERLIEKEKTLGDDIRFEDIIDEVAGVYPRIMLDGAMNAGAWSCGMVAGLIDDIPTVEELINRIMAEAEAIPPAQRRAMRRAKFRAMGVWGVADEPTNQDF